MSKQNLHLNKGFTSLELLISLSVMATILAAAATLAFAISTAEAATNEMGQRQAHIRFASNYIRELAGKSCLCFTYSTTGVIFWKDDANGDGKINGSEIAWLYVSNETGGYAVNVTEFPDQSYEVTRNALKYGNGLLMLKMLTDETNMVLIDKCISASISLEKSNKLLIVDFSLSEESLTKEYQFSGALGASADYLTGTDGSGELVTSDDDL